MYGLWVPSTVGHWHMSCNKPLLFSKKEDAEAAIDDYQKLYYYKLEAKKYDGINKAH